MTFPVELRDGDDPAAWFRLVHDEAHGRAIILLAPAAQHRFTAPEQAAVLAYVADGMRTRLTLAELERDGWTTETAELVRALDAIGGVPRG